MKVYKSLLCALFLMLAMASFAFADQGSAAIYYIPGSGNPLGTPCTGNQLLFGDSVQITIFWDSNLNGPTPDDPQPPVGESGLDTVNFNLTHFNGEETDLGAGYFYMGSYFVVHDLGAAPVYWLRVGRANPPICWNSDTFRVQIGVQDISLVGNQWHCVDTACPTSGNPPAAPTNVRASDDQYCLSVRVSWDALASTQSAFNIYYTGDPNPIASTDGPADTFKLVPVYNYDGVRSYFVKAASGAGESPASNSDNGSTFLVRFGADANITGAGHARDTLTIHYRVPPLSAEPCAYGTKIYLLHSPTHNNVYVRGAILAADSMADSVRFGLPSDTTLNFCKLLLVDSAYNQSVDTVFYDTTTTVFHLGHPLGAEPRTAVLPDHFELSQNFPNPFNPTTEIRFSIPVQSEIRIKVFNITGQLVRTLVQGNYTAGIHQVMWDGKSDAGIDVSTGIYIYRMEGARFSQTKKMLLLK